MNGSTKMVVIALCVMNAVAVIALVAEKNDRPAAVAETEQPAAPEYRDVEDVEDLSKLSGLDPIGEAMTANRASMTLLEDRVREIERRLGYVWSPGIGQEPIGEVGSDEEF